MSRRKEYLEDLEESKQYGHHVIRSHRRPPTGNVRKAVIGVAIAVSLFTLAPPVAGTSVKQAVAAPVIDAADIELVDPSLTIDYEIARLKEEIKRSRNAPAPVVVQATAPTWVHPLASHRQANSCYRTSRRPSHGGVDMAQPYNTPIHSIAKGTVYRKGFERGGAGYYVTIRHAGNVFSQYHHLRAHSPLSVGAPVQVDAVIGYVGSTGNATGNHLHFEIRIGDASGNCRVNPALFMRTKGISIGC